MYLTRKVDTYLQAWKQNPDRLPLIIKGPRQVGKTSSILEFANGAYTSVVYINFVEEPKYRSIVSDGYSVADIVRNISLLDPSKRFVEGETLVVFDEIQEFPDIATSHKFFKLHGRFDVICSGSMLGVNYKAIESNSVGYKADYSMATLDFEEYLWAKGYGQDVIDSMLAHLLESRAFSTLEADVYGRTFLEYCVLGGMPAVVAAFMRQGSFEGILSMQRQLVNDYREDIRKYVSGVEQMRVLNVFDHMPVQLATENKKFQVSKVASGARFKDYWGCIEWLENAGVINVCRCMLFPELPLKGNYDSTKYKLYFSDSGLFVSMLDDEASDDLRANRNLDVYKGGLYENIISEALVKQGFGLYYYRRQNSTLEQDFFVRTRTRLVPIEVKATNGVAKSMRTLIGSETYPDISWGIKIRGGNVGESDNVLTIPHYCAFLLKRYLVQRG